MNLRRLARLLLILAIGLLASRDFSTANVGQSQKDKARIDAFVESAEKGNLPILLSSLAGGIDPNSLDQHRMTALAAAAFEGHVQVVRALLHNRSKVDGRSFGWRAAAMILRVRDSSSPYSGKYPKCGTGTMHEMLQLEADDKLGVTPLMAAAFAGHAEIVQILLERGADIEATSLDGVTPLMFAVSSDRAEVAKILIARGANLAVTAKDEQSLVMVASCDRGRPDSLNLLLDAGADPNTQNKFGHSPLMGAAYANALEIVDALIKRGADVSLKSKAGTTALMFAIDANNVETVGALLDAGADINEKDQEGSTPLMLAAGGYEDARMTKLLIKHRADIRATDNYGVRTALLDAEMAENDVCATLLRAAGAELTIDAQLLVAAGKGDGRLVRELIAHGAEVNARGNRGRTALSYAADDGELDAVKALLENGAESNFYPDDGETPLMEAAFWGHIDVVSALIEHGADVNARLTAKQNVPTRDSNGTTALMRAAIRGQISVAHYLLQHGADTDVKNYKGETALSVAERFNNRNYVELLMRGSASR